MIRGKPVAHWTFVKNGWSARAREGLRETFYGHEDKIANGVRSGTMELFEVNGDSWLVTQVMGGMLFIWCYQGKALVQMVEKLMIICRANKLTQISFFTHHKAALRGLRSHKPRVLETATNGELQYVIDVPPIQEVSHVCE